MNEQWKGKKGYFLLNDTTLAVSRLVACNPD